MKLDRNINDDGMGKYALLKLRELKNFRSGTFGELAPGIARAIKTLENAGILDWGKTGTEAEFFVIRLKDIHAAEALAAYAASAKLSDPEYAAEVDEMVGRSGVNSPFCQEPD